MKIILFAPIEANLKDINSTKDVFRRYFEDEAIKAFECWRHSAGWLKDIPIYAICPTNATVSDRTRSRFRELNVTYVEAYDPITDEFSSGFWNIPLVGKWVEENIKADVLIKIDLDMYIIRPLPVEWFERLDATIVGKHDAFAEAHLAAVSVNHPRYKYFFNTGFTISTPSSRFFTKQLQYLQHIDNEFQCLGVDVFRQQYGLTVRDNVDRDDQTATERRLFEEICVSFMYEDGIPILPLSNYYLETSEYELDGEVEFDTDRIFFIHEHLDSNLSTTNLTNRLRYRRTFVGLPGYEFFMKHTTQCV